MSEVSVSKEKDCFKAEVRIACIAIRAENQPLRLD